MYAVYCAKMWHKIKVDNMKAHDQVPFVIYWYDTKIYTVLILPDINEEKWSVKQNMINHRSQLLECIYM